MISRRRILFPGSEFFEDRLAVFDDGQGAAVGQTDCTTNVWILAAEIALPQRDDLFWINSDVRPAWCGEHDKKQGRQDHRSPAE